MSTLAAVGAVEADRLVLGVNRARDRDRVARLAVEVGLEDWHLLGHWWDFLLAGYLTREIAALRSRYWPTEDVHAMLDRLLASGLVRDHAGGLQSTDRLTPVLQAIGDESGRVARNAWADHEDLVDVVAAGAARMIGAAQPDAQVVAAHRSMALPDDRHLALYCRLVTLRYIRQYDHAAAWAAHDLTAEQMRVYTALWEGGSVAADTAGRAELEARGLVAPGGPLTEAGQTLRDRIESETLQRSARTYNALEDGGREYLAAIRQLPTPQP